MGQFTPAYRGGSGEPLVLLHGFTDTWRTWELALPALEREHEVLAPTLPGHAGGPPLGDELDEYTLVEAVEAAMDEAGFETAHVAGNSLGGYVALQLAARGRARSAVALAPAGGWAEGDRSFEQVLGYFTEMQALVRALAPRAHEMLATDEGRRRASQYMVTNYEHIPAELLAHTMLGAARCDGAAALIDYALRHGWQLRSERIDCPVRIVWGTADQVLPWPGAAAGFRERLPPADWVEIDGVGHCVQLDVPVEAAQLILGMTRR